VVGHRKLTRSRYRRPAQAVIGAAGSTRPPGSRSASGRGASATAAR